jgi:hypothetical protein
MAKLWNSPALPHIMLDWLQGVLLLQQLEALMWLCRQQPLHLLTRQVKHLVQ